MELFNLHHHRNHKISPFRSLFGLTTATALTVLSFGGLPLAIAQTPSVSLRPDDSGEAVADLQRQLADLGYYNGEITGFFGSLTQDAVVRFQQDNGLTADGVVGSATEQALYGESSPAAAEQTEQDPESSAPRRMLRLNDDGDQVAELQRRLAALGYYEGEISGVFDRQTEAAVIQFQQDNGLTADGIVGASTTDALRRPTEEIARSPSPAPTTTIPPTTSTATPDRTTPLLRVGDSGTEVSALQTRLKELGFYQGEVTGSYDRPTEAAVIAFQRSQGLTPDGIAGPQVAAALTNPRNLTGGTTPPQNEQYLQARREAEQARQEAQQARLEAEQARLEAEQARLVLSQNMEEGRFSVVELQRHLQTNGFNPGGMNGVLTPETQQAIVEAQRTYGLTQGDLDLFGDSSLPY
ncbi:MAG: hypothetical protein HC769_00990 [Cyanobacteria bacterium CRU_2_1]|nr:hypothetical protein [Cyanobacteria bacterium RU_5_0]NJR57545.1 hypothetical protein [Cyanobacteria bacterium CRU_2_1]